MADSDTEALLGSKPTGCCQVGTMSFRFLMLVFIALICFGSYYSYDEITNLENMWTNSTNPNYLGISNADYGLMYSVYSFPNTILVFFGGIVGDRIGLRLSALIFGAFVFIGTALTAIGPMVLTLRPAWMMMMAGRVCLGIGAESLNVIQTSMTAVWFEDTKYLAMSFGLVLSMSRAGDFLAVSGGGLIAGWWGYRWVLWIGVIFTGVSFLAIIVYSVVDKYSETKVPKKTRPAETLNFKAVLHFDARFWLVSFITVLYYGGVTPFLANASDFLQLKWHFSPDVAGLTSSLILLSCMVLSPILGRIVDAVGYRPYFVVAGGIAILPAHLLLGLSTFTPFLSIVIIGLSFSLVPAALWPSVPLIIPNEAVSTAYGAMTAIQNAGLALVNLGIGKLVDKYPDNKVLGYEWTMVALCCMDVLAIALAQILLWLDRHRDRKLCSTNKGEAAAEPTPDHSSLNAGDYSPVKSN